MRNAIVTTTINTPHLLKAYARNANENGYEDVLFVVAGDRKTPDETRALCQEIEKENGYRAVYLGVEDQEKYLADFPELKAYLPYDSIQRRNVALLYAYQQGAERIVTIDDDNFLLEGDYLGGHAAAGQTSQIEVLSSSSGWLNVCRFLGEQEGKTFYHRGFPVEKRWMAEEISTERKDVRIAVNAGFWLGDPDVDAITRLALKPEAVSYEKESNFVLAQGTWSPFNSQNTALARFTIPAYFLSPDVGRYDDIWASYLIKRIADHLEDAISFGNPLVRQDRNQHNLMKDLEKEIDGMRLSGTFCQRLQEIELSKTEYGACLAEIADKFFESLSEQEERDTQLFRKFFEGIKVWIKTMERVS